MIRHAAAAAFPVGPLPVAVIEPSLPALLVPPVGTPPLLASHPASALLPAVDLPPIAGTADVKHHPATRPSAKRLPPQHFSGHTLHDSLAACEPWRVGGDAWGLDLGLGGVGKWADWLEESRGRDEMEIRTKHRVPVLNAAILVLAFAAAMAAQSTEIEQLRLAAEQGDASAQLNLGHM